MEIGFRRSRCLRKCRLGNCGLEFAGLDLREVDHRASNAVGIVREDVQCDVLNDLDDFCVIQVGAASGMQVAVGEVPALERDGASEFERGVGFSVRCGEAARGEDIVSAESGLAAEQRVGAQAVAAAINLGDGERNLLAQLRRKDAACERTAEAQVASERSRRIAEHAHEIWHKAKLALNGGEKLLGLARGIDGIDLLDSVHVKFVVLVLFVRCERRSLITSRAKITFVSLVIHI